MASNDNETAGGRAATLPLEEMQIYAVQDGTQAGPFTGVQLKELLKLGNLGRDTLVWQTGMAEWKPAGTIPELAWLFAPPPPPKTQGNMEIKPGTAKGPGGSVPSGFVKIPAGSFLMGSPESEKGREQDETLHTVTLDSFLMGEATVTVAEFTAFVKAANYTTLAEKEGSGFIIVQKLLSAYEQLTQGVNWKDPHFGKGWKPEDNHPVIVVTFGDCVEYCNWRSKSEGLRPAYIVTNNNDISWDRGADGYRLPTEAEWEYACRAGSRLAYSTGNTITANDAHCISDWKKGVVPVKSYKPNAWGLYCMHGNVFEWCWDFYAPYTEAAQVNPAGPASGAKRIIRGGSFMHFDSALRSASRTGGVPEYRTHIIGFRLARNG